MDVVEKVYGNDTVRIAYLAMLLILLLMIVWYTFPAGAEKLEGNQIYTAGATMRVLGQQFTSTDQGANDIVYNDEIKNWKDFKPSEGLVNERGNPDFWEINSTLNAYKEEQLPGYIA